MSGTGNDDDGPKVSRAPESQPAAKSEGTITWLVGGIGTIRLSNGVHECVLPNGTVVATFKSLKFALEFMGQYGQSISPEEQAVRLKADVDELRLKSPTDRMYWLADYAKLYGINETKLEQMIEAEIAAERQREQREKERSRQEKATAKEKRQEDDRQDRKARRDARDQQAADRRARNEAERIEREQKKREAVFAEIAELPKLTHEVRLKEAAKRLGEDFEVLVEEFEVFYAARTIPEDLEPWPDPVDTAELLVAIEGKFRRYMVASDAITTASVLYAPFTYVVEIATHAPKLIFTFPTKEAGKSTALHVMRRMVQRAYPAVEVTGAVLYRIIDRLKPTLCLDEADTLFKRRTALAHIINESWSNSGTKIPRTGPHGEILEFDPYGAQVIAMRGLHMPDTTLSRSIICTTWPKLAREVVEDFTYQDDAEFKVIRRKLARWMVDNAVALRDAKPVFPVGFTNRARTNWKTLFAIADLAPGGEWSKRARAAALELETNRDEPNEVVRLFRDLREIWGNAKEQTSESLCKALAAYSGEWADFRGKGPITPHQLAALLRPFGIRPIHGLHPTGRSDQTRGGYRCAQLQNAWTRLLQKPSSGPHTRTLGRRKKQCASVRGS